MIAHGPNCLAVCWDSFSSGELVLFGDKHTHPSSTETHNERCLLPSSEKISSRGSLFNLKILSPTESVLEDEHSLVLIVIYRNSFTLRPSPSERFNINTNINKTQTCTFRQVRELSGDVARRQPAVDILGGADRFRRSLGGLCRGRGVSAVPSAPVSRGGRRIEGGRGMPVGPTSKRGRGRK